MDLPVRPTQERDPPDLARREGLAAVEGVRQRPEPDAPWELGPRPGAGALVAVGGGHVVSMLKPFAHPSLMRAARRAQTAELVLTTSARWPGVRRRMTLAAPRPRPASALTPQPGAHQPLGT